MWLDQPMKARDAWTTARDRAEAMTKKYPRYGLGHFYLGASLVRLKKYNDARKALKKAERLDFDPPMVHFQMGLAYLFDEKWKPAKEEFDAVHEVDPRYAHLYFYRGIASEKLGRKADLINDMTQFVALAPNSPEASKAKAILSAVR
jgi:tetratricopeptide (TPR) repeat protein